MAVASPGVVPLSSTETFPASLAVIKSGLPSPLTSAVVTEYGALPAPKVCWVAKLGVAAPGTVVLNNTEIVLSFLLATIRSGLPSPLRSAVVTQSGRSPVAKVCWVAKLGVAAPGVVVLSSTETVLLPAALAAIRSGLPSPFTSAAVTDSAAPTATVC